MRIIKHGKKKVKLMRGTCRECGCKVEAEGSEAKYVEERPGDGDYCVKCPDCEYEFLWIR